jgi:hypothetical protein
MFSVNLPDKKKANFHSKISPTLLAVYYKTFCVCADGIWTHAV